MIPGTFPSEAGFAAMSDARRRRWHLLAFTATALVLGLVVTTNPAARSDSSQRLDVTTPPSGAPEALPGARTDGISPVPGTMGGPVLQGPPVRAGASAGP